MRLPLLALASALVLAGAPALARPAIVVPPIRFAEHHLANGLQVLESRDVTTPNVTIQMWYHVGAKNDPPGRSGFAHLFEHLMFKATRDMPPEEMDRLTEDVGGMNNAFTADDTTAFYEVVPANQLQRLIWAEAERMNSLVVDEANFHSERAVVEEELRQRVLAAPYGRLFYLDIARDSFSVVPYRRPPIGSIANLEAADLADVRAFHAIYYRPDDATLVVAGNFDPRQLDAWIEKYFGATPRPAAPIPQVTAVEPARTTSRVVDDYGPNVPLPAVVITWLAPPAASPDAAALQVLDAVLTAGKSSRLYDDLVYKSELADQVFSSADLHLKAGLFYAGLILAGGKTADQGLAALRSEIARVRAAPVGAAELEIAKNQILAQTVRERETIQGRANALGDAVVEEGDPNRANTDVASVAAVTPADVQRVALKYLDPKTETVIRYLPATARPAGALGAASAAPASDVGLVPLPPTNAPVATLLPPAERQAPPPAGPPVKAVLPVPATRTLANGLEVVVAKSSDLPLIAADLFVPGGAAADPPGKSGLGDLVSDVITEGAAGRSAEEIARSTEALGADLEASSSSEHQALALSVLAPQASAALAIMADVAERPTFAPQELERARKQALDELAVAYQQPGELAGIVDEPLVFAGTPLGHAQDGTPASLPAIGRADLATYQQTWWRPDNAILVVTGDVTPERGFALAQQAFGGWTRPPGPPPAVPQVAPSAAPRQVAVDLPGTGQAAVVLSGPTISRSDPGYYQALVADQVLGGGYSARLNQDVRVKRGLSYGAGSELSAMRQSGLFAAQAQTRNEAAGQVADLMAADIAALAGSPPDPEELANRKSALVGAYGRELATAAGLADVLGTLAVEGVPPAELDVWPDKVQAVTADQVVGAARAALDPRRLSLIVVGDASKFGPGLEAAHPGLTIIPVSRLDPDSPTLARVP
ncbi:MAG TPA: pitrilysin family protein [Caulobacteraceae bacterium]|nr:pitrilysin family protein [Caulobacteraceae bacterium]